MYSTQLKGFQESISISCISPRKVFKAISSGPSTNLISKNAMSSLSSSFIISFHISFFDHFILSWQGDTSGKIFLPLNEFTTLLNLSFVKAPLFNGSDSDVLFNIYYSATSF